MKPKVLYAIQCTGNGHIIRAKEVLPILKSYCDVDILVSGKNDNNVEFNFKCNYIFKGLTLYFNNKGKISFLKTIFKNNYFKFLWDILKLNTSKYDLVISDYEPISAWASKLAGTKSIGLSNQYSLLMDKKPKQIGTINWLIFKYFAPVQQKYGFGFIEKKNKIFSPIIRKEIKKIKEKKLKTQDHYLVYLPAFSNAKLFKILDQINENWIIFSNDIEVSFSTKRCAFYPTDADFFLECLATSKGVLCHSSFQLPAEALYLNKKLFVVPIKNQVEQLINAKKMNKLGIMTSRKLDKHVLNLWLKSDFKAKVNYELNLHLHIENILIQAFNEEIVEVNFI